MNTTVSFSVAPFEKDTVFSVLSNSTLSGISFNSTNKELSFTVSGPSGTTGYVDVYIAKSSINDVSNLIVHLDGNQIAYTSKSIGDSWLISFSYHHSTHQITMNLSATSSITIKEILLAIATGVIIAVLVTVAFSLILRERTKKTCD